MEIKSASVKDINYYVTVNHMSLAKKSENPLWGWIFGMANSTVVTSSGLGDFYKALREKAEEVLKINIAEPGVAVTHGRGGYIFLNIQGVKLTLVPILKFW